MQICTKIGPWFRFLSIGKPGFGRTLVEIPVQTPVFSPTVAPRRSQSSFNREGDTLIVTPSETISQTNQQTQQVGIKLKTKSCPFIQILSLGYHGFIQILSR